MVDDQPGMLGRLITAIGEAQAHVGTISTVGIQNQSKIRDIQVYCSGPEHLNSLLSIIEGIDGIFAEFANVSAIPILVDSDNVDEIVKTVSIISSGFGAIQLEDIAAPACFEIEEKLRDSADIPVLHDDQHGTATVVLAALINALKRTNRAPEKCSAIILGAGAAGYVIIRCLHPLNRLSGQRLLHFCRFADEL